MKVNHTGNPEYLERKMIPATAAAKPVQKVMPCIILGQDGNTERGPFDLDCGQFIAPVCDLERSLQFYSQNLNSDQTER